MPFGKFFLQYYNGKCQKKRSVPEKVERFCSIFQITGCTKMKSKVSQRDLCTIQLDSYNSAEECRGACAYFKSMTSIGI